MKNSWDIFKAFIGDPIFGHSFPFLIVTEIKQPNGDLITEYFGTFHKDNELLVSLRVSYGLDNLSEEIHNSEGDVLNKTFLMGLDGLQNFLDVEYLKKDGIQKVHSTVTLKEIDVNNLFRLHFLFSENMANKILDQTISESLKECIKKIKRIPIHKEIK